MHIERPDLHPMAELAIGELTSAGITIAPRDVLWLHHLAGKVEAPHGKWSAIDWIDVYLRVGNLKLYPLTIGANAWLQDCAMRWFSGSPQNEILSMAYAMAHARQPEAFADMMDKASAWMRLRAWAIRGGVTTDELDAAVTRIMDAHSLVDVPAPAPARNVPAKLPPAWSGLIGSLMERCPGTTARYWLWEIPLPQLTQLMQAWTMDNARADGKTEKIDGDKTLALIEFRAAVEHIRTAGNG